MDKWLRKSNSAVPPGDGSDEGNVTVNLTTETSAASGSAGKGALSVDGDLSGSAKLPIKIRTLAGKTYNIDKAKSDWTVARLKKEFERWHGEEGRCCSLFYKAKRLTDNRKLGTYKIEPDSTDSFIQANIRSTGGVWSQHVRHMYLSCFAAMWVFVLARGGSGVMVI